MFASNIFYFFHPILSSRKDSLGAASVFTPFPLRPKLCAMDKVPYKVLCAWTKCHINALQVFLIISYSQSLYKSLGNRLPKNNLWEVCYQTPLGFLYNIDLYAICY